VTTHAGPPKSELRELLALSVPLAAGHAGHQIMSVVDTAMVGRLGPEALGGVGIGNGIYFAFTVFGVGCVLGLDPLVAQALGAGEEARARRIYGQGLRLAVLVGIPLTFFIGAAPVVLEPVGVDGPTAREVQAYLLGRMGNAIPFLLFAAARSYLQAHHVTRPILVSIVVANLANFVGNALFIYGDESLELLGLPGIGLPALGVLGSGISSSLAAIFSFWVLARAVRALPAPPDSGARGLDPALAGKILRIGAPIGAQLLAEVGVFALVSVLAGILGAGPAAGHQVAITLASFTFTVALGIGAATAVRVGRQVGRADTRGARLAGFLGLRVALLFMSATTVLFLILPEPLAWLLTDDARAVAMAAPLVMIAGVFQLADGAQAVAAGALRGAGDTRAPLLANVLGHYAVGFPVAVALGFGAGLGAPGLWWGLCAGLAAVAVALIVRFARISSRPLVRI
jgi:MATE family multidrug resistance protein